MPQHMPTLRYRSKGTGVYRLQSALLAVQPYDDRDLQGKVFPQGKVLEADSDFGKITEQALRSFQTEKAKSDPSVVVDGVCGGQTWAALRHALGGALPGMPAPQIVSGGRLKGTPSASLERIEPPSGTPMPPWMSKAWAECAQNIHEKHGVAANPRILEYFKVGWVSKDTLGTAEAEGRRNAKAIMAAARKFDARVAEKRLEKGRAAVPLERTRAYQFAHARQRDLDEIPWCAAFVGWCLRQSGYPRPDWSNRLGAESWRPKNHKKDPGVCRYGAVAVIEKNNRHHVGFAIDQGPGWVRFLGGNQRDKLNRSGGAVNVRKYIEHTDYTRVTFLWPNDVWPSVDPLAA